MDTARRVHVLVNVPRLIQYRIAVAQLGGIRVQGGGGLVLLPFSVGGLPPLLLCETPTLSTYGLSTYAIPGGAVALMWGEHGWKVVAQRDIGSRERLTDYAGPRVSFQEAVQCWPQTHVNGKLRDEWILGLAEPQNGRGLASFVNHSANPNATLEVVISSEDGKQHVMLLSGPRSIKEGDELTISYGDRGSHSYDIAMGTGRYAWAQNGSTSSRSFRAVLGWDWEFANAVTRDERELGAGGAQHLTGVINAIADDSELRVVDVSVCWLNTLTPYYQPNLSAH